MRITFKEKDNKPEEKSRWSPELDRLMIAGIKHGPAEEKNAINRILQLVPKWNRADCWRRIRYLRNKGEVAKVAKQHFRANLDYPKARARRTSVVPWTTADDDKLLNLAGYEPVKKIAQRLGRSEKAVRFRLAALGISAKVTDGWSQRELRKMLRTSSTRLRYFIGNGMLRVRDPRISATSLALFCVKMNPSLSTSITGAVANALATEALGFSWQRVAGLLGVAQTQVQAWISAGCLRVVDPFVPDRAFQEFCHKHGHELRAFLIDPPIAKWLMKEYGVPTLDTKVGATARAQKHALVVRSCTCGRKIAGNAYFRHVRVCRMAVNACYTHDPAPPRFRV